MSNEARFYLSIKDGVFEISGSELFVSQQISAFKEVIDNTISHQKTQIENIPYNMASETLIEISQGTTDSSIDHSRILDLSGEKTRIIKSIKGSNTAEKVRKVALLYLRGEEFKNRQDIPFSEVRDLCRDQGCLDSNFSSIVKSNKALFIVDGVSGGNKTFRLTLPGREEADKLIQELNAA